jgi:hypothetical protein
MDFSNRTFSVRPDFCLQHKKVPRGATLFIQLLGNFG